MQSVLEKMYLVHALKKAEEAGVELLKKVPSGVAAVEKGLHHVHSHPQVVAAAEAAAVVLRPSALPAEVAVCSQSGLRLLLVAAAAEAALGPRVVVEPVSDP